jgi:flagellar FliL protein
VNVSAKPEAAEAGDAPKPAKSKKMLIIGLAVVLVLALAGGGAFFYISKQRAAAAEEGDDAASAKAASHAGPKAAPAYLPLDNMVVNLSDPGGERVAQVGITLEVLDAHAVDTVKGFLPTIRSGILMLISQRTAEELLTQEGKQKLAKDILREASLPFGGGDADGHGDGAAPVKKKKSDAKSGHGDLPVVGVLFSSFIVQ